MPKFILILTFTALSACGYATDKVNSDVTQAKLESDTARYFETSRSNVSVGSFRQSIVGTSYKARVAGNLYDCSYFRSALTCARAQRPI